VCQAVYLVFIYKIWLQCELVRLEHTKSSKLYVYVIQIPYSNPGQVTSHLVRDSEIFLISLGGKPDGTLI
jgi:hypothetical protein